MYSNPELNWLEQVAMMRSTSHSIPMHMTHVDFFQLVQKWGKYVLKVCMKYMNLDVCSWF